ncbi:helix-turn-helix domain-containing protein [Gordonia sp. CPCC 205333]|uniref:helix-turn-helix domain-containing protein n=1 Tax=Gordonia sp. CPCC 205333 TaxID=3140790 RepID=UPI003AF3C483
MPGSAVSAHPTFANLLAELFDNTFSGDGTPVTASEIARRIDPDLRAVKESYLSQLRSGAANEPSLNAVRALAEAFDIDIVYFTRRYQTEHSEMSAAERVFDARRTHNIECYRMAAAISELPEYYRASLRALIDILHQHQLTNSPRTD